MRFIPPHDVKSRDVVEDDLPRVFEHGAGMFDLCHEEHGLHKGGARAVAHSQVTCLDPLRFFVTHEGDVIVNPKITRHTAVKIVKEEGCMSYPNLYTMETWRWNKCEVTFMMLDISDGEKLRLSTEKHESLSGHRAHMFQHEIDHLDGIYITNATVAVKPPSLNDFLPYSLSTPV